MTRLLDPKVDFIFKKIFGSEKHPQILISFLNAVIKPATPIISVELKDTDINKDSIDDKFSRLDVKAITSNGEHINVEIQLKNEYNMIKRTLYYWSKIYSEQLNEGEKYSKLSRTVCINILNFKYLPTDNFHSCYRLKEITTHEELTDVQELHFIEVPKLSKVADITDLLVAWVEFLKDPESEEVRSLELSMEEIREAKTELVRLSNDDSQRALYEAREKANKDRTSALEQSKEEGREEGEKKKAIEVAKTLLKNNIDIQIIATSTGLSISEIEDLKNK